MSGLLALSGIFLLLAMVGDHALAQDTNPTEQPADGQNAAHAGAHQRVLRQAGGATTVKPVPIAGKNDDSLFAICTDSNESGPRPVVVGWFQWVDSGAAIKYVVAEVQGEPLKGVKSIADVTSIELSLGGGTLALDKVSKLDRQSASYPVLAQGVIDDAAVKQSFGAAKLATADALWAKLTKDLNAVVVAKTADLTLKGYLDLPMSMGAVVSLVKWPIVNMTTEAKAAKAADHHSYWDVAWWSRRDASVSTDIEKACFRAILKPPFTCEKFTDPHNCTLDVVNTFDDMDLCCASFRGRVDPYQVTCNMYKSPSTCIIVDKTCKKSPDEKSCTGRHLTYSSMDSCNKFLGFMPKKEKSKSDNWDRADERARVEGRWERHQVYDGYGHNQDEAQQDRYDRRDPHSTYNRMAFRQDRQDGRADQQDASWGTPRDSYRDGYERSSWARSDGYDRNQDRNWGRRLSRHVTRVLHQTQTATTTQMPAFGSGDMSKWALCEPIGAAAGKYPRSKAFAWLHWSDQDVVIKYVVTEVLGAPFVGVGKKDDVKRVTLNIPGGASLELARTASEFNRSMDQYTTIAKGIIDDAAAAKAKVETAWDLWQKILDGTTTVVVSTKSAPDGIVKGQVDLPYSLGSAFLQLMPALGSIKVPAAAPDRARWDSRWADSRYDERQYSDRRYDGPYRDGNTNTQADQGRDYYYDRYQTQDARMRDPVETVYDREANYQPGSQADRWQDEQEQDRGMHTRYSNNWDRYAAQSDGERDEGYTQYRATGYRNDGERNGQFADQQDGYGRDYYQQKDRMRWDRQGYESSQQTQDWQPYRG